MALPLRFFFLFFFFACAVLPLMARETPGAGQAASPLPAAASSSSAANSTEFIRARCGATRYPSLCFSSLAAFSGAVRGSPVQLARVSANLTVVRLSSLASRVATLRRHCGPRKAASAGGCPEAGALKDCTDVLDDAADLARRTSAELRGLLDEAPGSPAAAWRVANAQTWLSAVLTNEDTCSDGFGEVVPGSRARADVAWRLLRVKQYTSNALALVNCLSGGRQ